MSNYCILHNAVLVVAYVLLTIRSVIFFSISLTFCIRLIDIFYSFSINYYDYYDYNDFDWVYVNNIIGLRLFVVFGIYFGFTTFSTILLVKGIKNRFQSYIIAYLCMDLIIAVALTVVDVYLIYFIDRFEFSCTVVCG